MGKEIIHVAVFKKNDERTIYNMIYKDGASGVSYIKRFAVTGVTRDKEYDLTKGSKASKVWYFSANPNGEAEIINVQLKPHSKLKKLQFDEDFAGIAIKGRGSIGNIITKYPVKKIVLKSKGISTLSGRKIWYDEILKRLNVDTRGKYLGEFDGDDRVLTVMANGIYELTSFDLNNHFFDNMLMIEKYNPRRYTRWYISKASRRITSSNVSLLKIHPRVRKPALSVKNMVRNSPLLSGELQPMAKIEQLKGKTQTPESIEVSLAELIDVKGMKAMGNRVSQHTIQAIILVEPPETEKEEIAEEELEEAVALADTAEEEIVAPEEVKTEPVIPELKPAEAVKEKPIAPVKEKKQEPTKAAEATPEKLVESTEKKIGGIHT